MEGNLHSELGVRDAYVLAFFKTRVGWNLFRQLRTIWILMKATQGIPFQ